MTKPSCTNYVTPIANMVAPTFHYHLYAADVLREPTAGVVESAQLTATAIQVPTNLSKGSHLLHPPAAYSPLFMATQRWLALAGANNINETIYVTSPTSTKPEPTSLFHLAAKTNDIQTMRLLVGIGADVNKALPSSGLTPLMEASADGCYDAVVFLLCAGAHVNAVDSNGTTALLAAVQEERVPIVELLLQHDADPNMEDMFGTPLEQAHDGGNAAIVELLLLSAHGTCTSQNSTSVFPNAI